MNNSQDIPALLLPNMIDPGTYTKVTFDSKGRAILGDTLDASDIPSLFSTKISDFATAVDARITAASLQPLDADLTAIAALAPSDGTFIRRTGGTWTAAALLAADIPSLLSTAISDFSTAADARITNAIGSTVEAYDADLTAIAALAPADGAFIRRTGGVWVGTTLVAGDIPVLDTSKLTTGQLALARGGTAADLSASGSATAILAQDASHVISARALIAADIPTLTLSKISDAGTMAAQNANAVVITGGTIDGANVGPTTPGTGAFTTAYAGATGGPAATELTVVTTSAADPRGIMSAQYSTDALASRIHLRKARGTPASPTTIVTGDLLGRIRFSGYDGSNFLQMASIDAVSTGTIASTRIPTYLSFSVATNVTPSVLTERMAILASGFVGMGTSLPSYNLHVLGTGNPTTIAAEDTSNDARFLMVSARTGAGALIATMQWDGKNSSSAVKQFGSIQGGITTATAGAEDGFIRHTLSRAGTAGTEVFRQIPASSTFTGLDAVTAAVTNVAILAHATSGTPAPVFGTGLAFQGYSATPGNGQRDMGRVRTEWTTATDLSRASKMVLSTYAVGVETDAVTIESSGKVTIASSSSVIGLRVRGQSGSGNLWLSLEDSGPSELAFFKQISFTPSIGSVAGQNFSIYSGGVAALNFGATGLGSFTKFVTASDGAKIISTTALSGFAGRGGLHIFTNDTALNPNVIIEDDFLSTQKWSLGLQGHSKFAIEDITASATRLIIDTSGNVGIGNITPTALLDVNSDIIRLRTAKTPASAAAAGNQGDIAWDASFFYICVAASTWRRVAHATW